MDCCFVRKVPYKMAGKNPRLVWAMILAEREGLSLLFVQKPDDKQSHIIAIAAENVTERVFEDVNASKFNLEPQDLAVIGTKLQALGQKLSDDEFVNFFKPDDRW